MNLADKWAIKMAVDCWLADINDVDSNVKGQRLTAVTTWVDQVTDPDFFFFFFFLFAGCCSLAEFLKGSFLVLLKESNVE